MLVSQLAPRYGLELERFEPVASEQEDDLAITRTHMAIAGRTVDVLRFLDRISRVPTSQWVDEPSFEDVRRDRCRVRFDLRGTFAGAVAPERRARLRSERIEPARARLDAASRALTGEPLVAHRTAEDVDRVAEVARVCGPPAAGGGEAPAADTGEAAPGVEPWKLDALRAVVAWIVEGRALPGTDEPYADADWMRGMSRFVLVVQDVPRSTSLSEDPRVLRMDRERSRRRRELCGYDGTDYLAVRILDQGQDHIRLSLSNTWAWLAGHGYEIELRRGADGVRATVEHVWVS